MKGKQLLMSFVRYDKPCRTCRYSFFDYEHPSFYVICGLGQLGMGTSLRGMKYLGLPDDCKRWKKGGEKVPYINFKDLTEKELREELEKIRLARTSIGKRKRIEGKERRVKSAKKEKTYIEL